MTSLSSRVGRASREFRRIAQTHYPRFVFGGRIAPGQHYAFVYHDVDPEEFRRDLEFLDANGYETVGVGDFVSRGNSLPERCVLLTFDDARRNFWEVAYPLLKESGARATLFVPTHWIEDDSDEASGRFMTWDQLRHCAEGDVVDVESHAHRHALVYTEDRLLAWTTPRNLDAFDIYEWPLRLRGEEEGLGPPPLGTPIYGSQPLLSAGHALVDSPEVTVACQDLVRSQGGAEFFDQAGWRSQLERRRAEACATSPALNRMDDDRFSALVASEFELAGERFQRNLGRRPRFFAYPWRLGSDVSMRAAEANGIEAVFGVGLDFRRAKDARILPAFGRLKGDWLRCLPGLGRRSLTRIIGGKIRQLTRARHLSH